MTQGSERTGWHIDTLEFMISVLERKIVKVEGERFRSSRLRG